MYGKGLNSIRWRFSLATAVLAAAAFGLHGLLVSWLGTSPWVEWGSLLLGGLLVTLAMWWMASRLTGLLSTLQKSTEAVAEGDFDSPIDVDCACEVGGLANSFRRMKHRFNANVLRMNMLAYTDPITGLPNRSVIQHLLDYSLAPEREGAFSGAIVFIDLDGFKRINDTLGHDGGDELLRLASARLLERGLQRTLQTIDTCMDPFGNPCERLPQDVVFARFAGDEFVAVLPGVTDRELLSRVGERVVESLAEPFRIKGQAVLVGASVGIAIAPEDTDNPAELLGFADMAMYGAKQAGKARFRFFDKQVRERMVRHAEIEAELRLALERDELVLHYQPKLRTDSLDFVGVEALVRWQHPRRGLVGPGEFIEVAEKTGLMAALGQRVLELAVRQARAWADVGTPRTIAVNVSPLQFSDPAFVDKVLATLHEVDAPPSLISIEITESMAMSDFETTAGRLARLREAGLRVALDDFGIGFSNLSQLSRVPLDDLKIDRSLVCGIGRNAKSEAIIRAIVAMTHALGFRTVAEGIEEERQLAFLREVGCTLVQGFLFARPMAARDLEAWVGKHQPQPVPA